MIRFLDSVDKCYSLKLHELDITPVTILLYPFAFIFNYKCFIFHIALVAFICHESIIFPISYVLAVIYSVAMTLLLKQALKRPRPIPNTLQIKPMTFRLMEGNNSMPSGDSMQAAVFVYYMFLPIPSLSSLQIVLAFSFVVLVGLARVYYRCHYFGDVVVGVVLGYMNGLIIHKITEIIFYFISL